MKGAGYWFTVLPLWSAGIKHDDSDAPAILAEASLNASTGCMDEEKRLHDVLPRFCQQ